MPATGIDPDEPPEPLTLPRRSGGTATASIPVVVRSEREAISTELALTIHRHMVRTRALEERSLKLSKSGEAYFWIGGPGEEAMNVCLGLQIHRGRGPAHDYLHLHYRNAGILMGMGMSMLDHVRQLVMSAQDRHSLGRNFVGHYAIPEWNVVPVTSVVEVQCVMGPGTALVQKRFGGEGLSLVLTGDAGTAEGDFESGLLWSSRPGNELPVLIVVANNGYGISTAHTSQHSAKRICDRGLPLGIRGECVEDGNDPVLMWNAVDRAMRYVRTHRRPYILEAKVSRLHGHSSSSGAQRDWDQPDCLTAFEKKLLGCGALDEESLGELWSVARAEADDAADRAVREPKPTAADVLRHTYAPSKVDAVYPADYTGLPQRRQ